MIRNNFRNVSDTHPRLLITMGDPAGVGPEVLLSCLAGARFTVSLSIIGDLRWLRAVARHRKLQLPWSRFSWVDLGNLPRNFRVGRVNPSCGQAAYEYLREAVGRLKAGEADALVTAPVSKQAIAEAGIPWVGHTEFLSQAFRRPTTMMFVTGGFRVSLVTTHVGLRRLTDQITRGKVAGTVRMTRESLIRDFGIARPRIGLAALNPHAGEGGLFGTEEKKLLRPVARKFRGQVEGPLPADSLMRSAAEGAYDAVVALYHDQALISVKLLGWEKAVNVTLGLPFVRTSPVHGTAFDLAGTGRADHRSMLAAMKLAIHLARRRQRFIPQRGRVDLAP